MISPSAREYLDAFAEYLDARVESRDEEFAATWKRAALRNMVADIGRDPDEFLGEVPREPRGAQNTPRSNEKRQRRKFRRSTSPKEGA